MDKGLLGNQTPAILLDTMVFLCGLNLHCGVAINTVRYACCRCLSRQMVVLLCSTQSMVLKINQEDYINVALRRRLLEHTPTCKTLKDALYSFTNTTCLFDHMVHLMMPSICSLCVPGHMGIGINVSQLDIIH